MSVNEFVQLVKTVAERSSNELLKTIAVMSADKCAEAFTELDRAQTPSQLLTAFEDFVYYCRDAYHSASASTHGETARKLADVYRSLLLEAESRVLSFFAKK